MRETTNRITESLHELTEKSPKVKKMFEAVISLIAEGADINTIKVSDITNRAGIGKGTAYEYFKTKEEIVAKAILFDVEATLQQVETELEKCSGFREKLSYVLDWLEENFSGRHSLAPFLNIYQDSCRISASLKSEMMNQVEGYECVMRRSQKMVEEGIEEGLLRDDLPLSMMTAVFVSCFPSLLFFMNWPEKEPGASNAQMKQFLCDNIIRSLSKPE